jgi:hypothetical protein
LVEAVLLQKVGTEEYYQASNLNLYLPGRSASRRNGNQHASNKARKNGEIFEFAG